MQLVQAFAVALDLSHDRCEITETTFANQAGIPRARAAEMLGALDAFGYIEPHGAGLAIDMPVWTLTARSHAFDRQGA